MAPEKRIVALWDFPECDLVPWQMMTSNHESYASYQAWLMAIEEQCELGGDLAVRVSLTVADMSRSLALQALQNNSPNRSIVLARAIQEDQK